MEVTLESWNDEGALLNCRATVEDRTIAKGSRCLCTFIDGERLIDPEEMRIRFRELTKDAEIE
jgi:hypothetical protein